MNMRHILSVILVSTWFVPIAAFGDVGREADEVGVSATWDSPSEARCTSESNFSEQLVRTPGMICSPESLLWSSRNLLALESDKARTRLAGWVNRAK
jgi:hypothetical protein